MHRRASPSRQPRVLPAPPDLEATTFSTDDDDYVIFSFTLPEIRLPEGLSEAERAVVRAVLDGRSNAEIARERGTSANTIANQLRSVYAKLRISGRIELIRCCVSQGRFGSGR